MIGINAHPTQLIKGDVKRNELDYWKAWAEKEGVPFFDAYCAFAGMSDKQNTINKCFIKGDVHYNEYGCEQVAKSFIAFWSQNRDK